MGKRLSIKVLDLLAVGCVIRQKIIHMPADDQYPESNLATLLVLLPYSTVQMLDSSFVDGTEPPAPSKLPQGIWWTFDFEVGDNLIAACDYNDWGANQQTLAPILYKLSIPHEVF